MKKNRILSVILLIIAISCLLVGCKKEPTINTYTVTFDANGGGIASGFGVQTVNEGEDATPPTVERKGYEFDGWEGNYTDVTADSSVRAKWIPVHTVIFDINGGTASDASLLRQSVRDGEAAAVPEVTREGYEFDGWSVEDLTSISTDVTATAQWTRVWTVRYFLTGGDVTNDRLLVQTIREDENPVDPKPKRNKYTFIKWNVEVKEDTSTKYYTAVWEKTKYSANEISKLANAATAEIVTYRPGGDELALGSGFFINNSGLLVTNYHVVKGGRSIKVQLGNISYYANNIVNYDAAKDIALIQVNTGGKKTSYLEFNSTLPKVGDTVYAVGSSLGLTGTFSSGIVSYASRLVDGVKFIQTTAPISSGNSGGPLINEYGEVIGMNTATYAEGQNLNLAVTANDILSVKKYSQSIDLSSWFYYTTDFFLPGDIMYDYGNAATMVGSNGVTYKCTIGSSDQIRTTVAESADQLIMITIKVDDYNKLSRLRYDFLTAELRPIGPNGTLYYDKYSQANVFKSTIKLEDGSGMLMLVYEIPDDWFNKGYDHFGLYLYGVSTPIDYEYFAWIMYPEDFIDLEDLIK